MKYLIDTDWIIHYLHGNEKVVEKILSFRNEGFATSVISLAELYEGVYPAILGEIKVNLLFFKENSQKRLRKIL